MRRVLLLFPLLVACSETLPENRGRSPFWVDVDTSQGTDLGFVPERITDPAPSGPLRLEDVTVAAGLGDAIGGGNSHGVGIAFVDLSGDGWPDVFVANGLDHDGTNHRSYYYVNQKDGTFADRTAASGLDALSSADLFSVAAADFDADGDVDLYVGASINDILMVNQGDGTFRDGTVEARAGGPPSNPALFGDGRSKVVSFGDFDGDGDLDIVSASSALPARGAYLLLNAGDGTFVDATESSDVHIDPFGNPCAVLWSDYDTDGDQDLWIWNDRGGKVLLENDGAGRFEDVTESSGAARIDIGNPMGIDAADIDHDGDLDYYVSNIGNNPLLRNNGDKTFSNITGRAGTGGDYGWGLAFEDFDLDGWPDLFVAQEDDRPHLLFHHDGVVPPTFERIEVEHREIMSSRRAHNVAAAFADYDRDGRVDVVLAGTDGARIVLYRNTTDVGDHRYLHVFVEPANANRTGVTARVAVKTGELVQFKDLLGGSSRASQNEHSVRFGLGPYTGADWAVVLWPNGTHDVWHNLKGDQMHTLTPKDP